MAWMLILNRDCERRRVEEKPQRSKKGGHPINVKRNGEKSDAQWLDWLEEINMSKKAAVNELGMFWKAPLITRQIVPDSMPSYARTTMNQIG